MGAFILLFAYIIQIIGIAAVACVLSFIPILIVRKRGKKVMQIVFLIVVAIVVVAMGVISRNPLWRCPEEYSDYVSENDKETIIAFNSGPYSFEIPVIPVCITVKDADENGIKVTTQYLFFGRRDMELGRDGPYTTNLY